MKGKDFWVLIAGISGNVIEKIITIYAVHHGASEKNPSIAFLIPYWGLYLSLVFFGIIAILSLIKAYHKREQLRWPLYAVSGLYVGIAFWNILLILAYNTSNGLLVF